MSSTDQSITDILNELEELGGGLPELSKDQTVRLLTQEEDFFTGISAFNNAVEQVEDHISRGAEIEGIDYDQIRDDRLAIHNRYASRREFDTQFWHTGQILDDIVQNEPNWMESPDGPMNDLVHLHPNPDGGLIYDKISQIKDARITYPDGGGGEVTIDYDRVREEARRGSIAAIEQKGLKADLEDLLRGQEDIKNRIDDIDIEGGGQSGSRNSDDTYGIGFGNWADTEEKNRRGFLRDAGIGIGALGGIGVLGYTSKEVYDWLTAEEQPGNGNGHPPEIQNYDTVEDFNQATGSTLTYDEIEAFADTSGHPGTDEFDLEYDSRTGDLTVKTEAGERIGTYPGEFK